MGRRKRHWRWVALGAVTWFGLLAQGTETPPMQPGELVRRAVQNEVKASQNESVNHMFMSRKESGHGSQTKLYCETKDAMAGLAVAYDDKPLTSDQRLAEQSRLDQLMKSPDELQKKRQREKDDAERVARIVRALPDAFLYEYSGSEPSTVDLGKAGDELVRLKFRPNPKYDPPSRTEQVLQGMQGFLLIDSHTQRIARIDGTLFKDVGFGWGILGHLDKGGHFLVEQGDVGDGAWDIRRMSLAFTGKILLLKRIDIKSTEVFSDFRPVPSNLTFAQGVALLKQHEGGLASDGHGTPAQHK
jgi:hypothetical protein